MFVAANSFARLDAGRLPSPIFQHRFDAGPPPSPIVQDRVTIGPQCFIADSKIEADAYLGAQVRTSNHRLDKKTVEVMVDGERLDTGLEKLGCLIGARAALGIQVIVLPGREIAAGGPQRCLVGAEEGRPGEWSRRWIR